MLDTQDWAICWDGPMVDAANRALEAAGTDLTYDMARAIVRQVLNPYGTETIEWDLRWGTPSEGPSVLSRWFVLGVWVPKVPKPYTP